jgi:hypothetical protein
MHSQLTPFCIYLPFQYLTNRDVLGTVSKVKNIRIFKKLPNDAENTILYETLYYETSETGKLITKKTILGEQEEEFVSQGDESVKDNPVEYRLIWIIDVGLGNFRRYIFLTRKKNQQMKRKTIS